MRRQGEQRLRGWIRAQTRSQGLGAQGGTPRDAWSRTAGSDEQKNDASVQRGDTHSASAWGTGDRCKGGTHHLPPPALANGTPRAWGRGAGKRSPPWAGRDLGGHPLSHNSERMMSDGQRGRWWKDGVTPSVSQGHRGARGDARGQLASWPTRLWTANIPAGSPRQYLPYGC